MFNKTIHHAPLIYGSWENVFSFYPFQVHFSIYHITKPNLILTKVILYKSKKSGEDFTFCDSFQLQLT